MTESWAQWAIMLAVTVFINAAVVYGTLRAFMARTEERLRQDKEQIDVMLAGCKEHSKEIISLDHEVTRHTGEIKDHERRITKLEDRKPIGVS